MKRMSATALLVAAGTALCFAGDSHADLIGTEMDISIMHEGFFNALSALNNVTYTYGETSVFSVPNWGSVTISSPEGTPGFDHAMHVDFTAFAYNSFAGPFATIGTMTVANLAEAVESDSVQVLLNGVNITHAAVTTEHGFIVKWNTQDVLNGNPINPNITVAWNSVPGPGALALMGIATAIAPVRRRRN